MMSAMTGASAQQIVVGASADFPPFEWVDGKGNLVGFDMDVMRALAIVNGYKVEIRDLGFDTLISSLQNDRLDILAGIQINEERRKVVDSSKPYKEITFGIAVHKDSPDNLFTAVQPGKKVGAQRGSTQARWLDRNVVKKGVGITVELYDTTDLIVLDLVNKRIDAYVGNDVPMREFAKRNPIRITGTILDLTSNFAYLVKKGDPKGLAPKLDSGIEKLKADGVWADLEAAYFTGNVDRITNCYGTHQATLNEAKDLRKYAADLRACMVD